MSFQLVCDICGKDSGRGQAVFNMGSIELDVKNFKGQEFKIFVNMDIKNKEDYEFVESIKNKSAEELHELTFDEDMVINTPDPHICILCQRELSSKVLREGIINKDDNVTQEIKVTLQSFILPQAKLDELDDFYSQEDYGDEFDEDEEFDDIDIDEDEDEK